MHPRCLVLPQGIACFSASVNSALAAGSQCSVEAVLGGKAMPIRALPGAMLPETDANFSPTASLSFPPTSHFTSSAGTASASPELQIVEFDVDIGKALPGLMRLNVWSSGSPSSLLLASESVLLLGAGLDDVADDLADEAGGEDLLADLAYIIDDSPHHSDASSLRMLLDTAAGLKDWSEAAGCAALGALVLDRIRIIEEKLVYCNGQAAAHGSFPEPIKQKQQQQLPKQMGPADRLSVHLLCYSVLQVTGIAREIFIERKGESQSHLAAAIADSAVYNTFTHLLICCGRFLCGRDFGFAGHAIPRHTDACLLLAG